MALEATLTDITTRLRQGRSPFVPLCHAELVEASPSFPFPAWLIRLAAEVAGLTFGKDVIVEF